MFSSSAESLKQLVRRSSSKEKERRLIRRTSSKKNKENGAGGGTKSKMASPPSQTQPSSPACLPSSIDHSSIFPSEAPAFAFNATEPEPASEDMRVPAGIVVDPRLEHSAEPGDPQVFEKDCTETDIQTFHVTLTYKPRI